MSEMLIKGTYIAAYIMCKTKLWYFSHDIDLGDFNENV
ncbi:MAG: Dna2/Cas4 domain-containing protein [Caldisphaera sp.]